MTSTPGVVAVVVAGEAAGKVVVLEESLSFWGGFDVESGRVIDEHHPQVGETLTGKVVVMAVGRGSSSASSVIAEAVRIGTAPAALVMRDADEIISTGAIVADELYGRSFPIVRVDESTFAAASGAESITISVNGELTIK